MSARAREMDARDAVAGAGTGAVEGDLLRWLQAWYANQCDGDWEHQQGIQLETLDNPGWTLRVDLAGTALWNRPFARVQRGDIDSGDWAWCGVRAFRFEGSCGPLNLGELLGMFRAWAEGPTDAR